MKLLLKEREEFQGFLNADSNIGIDDYLLSRAWYLGAKQGMLPIVIEEAYKIVKNTPNEIRLDKDTVKFLQTLSNTKVYDLLRVG